jgi:hypothetical protein
MARQHPNPGTQEEALRDDGKRSPEVEAVVDRFFGDDPDDEPTNGGQR